MINAELISACIKNDKTAKKQFFESYYKKFAFIALRYSKNKTQAESIVLSGFSSVFKQLPQIKNQSNADYDKLIRDHFIISLVNEIKNIRNEYYVSSTIKATDVKDKSYDLFTDSVYIDFRNIKEDDLIKSLQELVPSQRLAFNLHIIDGYDISLVSTLLETNEQTIKSNIEKARFNLQKNSEKNLKIKHNEQPV